MNPKLSIKVLEGRAYCAQVGCKGQRPIGAMDGDRLTVQAGWEPGEDGSWHRTNKSRRPASNTLWLAEHGRWANLSDDEKRAAQFENWKDRATPIPSGAIIVCPYCNTPQRAP